MNSAKISMAGTLILALVSFAGEAQAEMMFGVKPATTIQSSYFGFLAGTSMVVEFGLDYARVNVKVEGETEGDFGFEPTVIDAQGGASMFMPHGGFKLYLKPRAAGMTAPYFLVDVFKAFSSVDLGEDGDALEDAEEFAGDLLSPFGLNLGFGAEYNFSDRFSLGGEYGFRYMMSSSDMSEIDMEVSTSLGATYAAISANFVF